MQAELPDRCRGAPGQGTWPEDPSGHDAQQSNYDKIFPDKALPSGSIADTKPYKTMHDIDLLMQAPVGIAYASDNLPGWRVSYSAGG
jgi:hypothetical protein